MPVRVLVCKGHGQLVPATEQKLDAWFYEACQYYNELVRLENEHRERFKKALRDIDPGLVVLEAAEAQAEAAEQAALKECRKSKQATRSRVASKETREAAAGCRAALKVARKAVQAARSPIYKTAKWKEIFKQLVLERSAAIVVLYNSDRFKNMWWGVKGQLRSDLERAAKDTLIYLPVKPREYSHNGKLSTQLTGKTTLKEVLACTDTRFRLRYPYDPKRRELGLAQVRLESNGGKPVWTDFFVRVDRTADELPPDAIVTAVHIVRRKGHHIYHGGQFRPYDYWSLQICANMPDTEQPERPTVAAIDVGWRKKEDGSLRVAYWVDTLGNSQEFCLPQSILQKWLDAREIDGLRRKAFNDELVNVQAWCENNKHVSMEVVDLAEWLKHTGAYRSLYQLIDRWDIFPMEIMCSLIEWHIQDKEQEKKSSTLVHKAANQRLELYRQFACRMGKTYGKLIIEQINLAEMRVDPEDDDDETEVVLRFWRNAAACGLLLRLIGQNRWCPVEKLKCAYTTVVCRHCDSIEDWDKKQLEHVCSNCQQKWDQDENASQNLLRMYLDGLTSMDDSPADPKKPKKKFLPRRKTKEQVQNVQSAVSESDGGVCTPESVPDATE